MNRSQHLLVLESEAGEAQLIDAEFMEKTLKPQSKIDLIVLQACQSEYVGEALLKNCAHHVICINKDLEVLDQASVVFTENLYKTLMLGTEKVTNAFEHAVRQTVFKMGDEKEDEIRKCFKILSNSDSRDHYIVKNGMV